ncbi:hypothetical protein D3C72_1476320 [compost metagenome]
MPLVNVKDIFQTAFGFVPVKADRPFDVYVNDSSFEEMNLRHENGKVLQFAGIMDAEALEDGIYAPPPLVRYRRSKKLIITEMDGDDNDVVERYGTKSWEISIKGILIDMVNHNYPSQKVRQLRELFEYNRPFGVEGQIWDDLNIRSIYFSDTEIGGIPGYADTIQFDLTARSIKPAEFFLNQTNA